MAAKFVDCQWPISAPPGRRLKFTVDHQPLELESEGEYVLRFYGQDLTSCCSCHDDYESWLEIRDGTSAIAPLIGRYCYVHVPSTIFSTGSHIHLHFRGKLDWNATVELGSLSFSSNS